MSFTIIYWMYFFPLFGSGLKQNEEIACCNLLEFEKNCKYFVFRYDLVVKEFQ